MCRARKEKRAKTGQFIEPGVSRSAIAWTTGASGQTFFASSEQEALRRAFSVHFCTRCVGSPMGI